MSLSLVIKLEGQSHEIEMVRYVVDMNGQSTVSPEDETMIIFKTFSFGRFFILNCGFSRGFVKRLPFCGTGATSCKFRVLFHSN